MHIQDMTKTFVEEVKGRFTQSSQMTWYFFSQEETQNVQHTISKLEDIATKEYETKINVLKTKEGRIKETKQYRYFLVSYLKEDCESKNGKGWLKITTSDEDRLEEPSC